VETVNTVVSNVDNINNINKLNVLYSFFPQVQRYKNVFLYDNKRLSAILNGRSGRSQIFYTANMLSVVSFYCFLLVFLVDVFVCIWVYSIVLFCVAANKTYLLTHFLGTF